LDNVLIYLVIGLALGACLFTPLMMLVFMKHQDRVELDHYGKYRGQGPAKSFVCPECLTRSYAPSHVARRYCGKCEKSFPEREPKTADVRVKAWHPEVQPAE
jgi:ribosomal protein S27AE